MKDTEEQKRIDQVDKIAELKTEIEELHAQMEKLGEDGKVEESQAMLAKVTTLQEQKTRFEQIRDDPTRSIGGESREDHRLSVCSTCGGFIVIGDKNESRVQSHMEGKQHLGYMKVREDIEKLKDIIDGDRLKKKKHLFLKIGLPLPHHQSSFRTQYKSSEPLPQSVYVCVCVFLFCEN